VQLWLVGALAHTQLLPGLPLSAVMVLCPLVAALILVAFERGSAGVAAHLDRARDFRLIENKKWYAPILLLMPATAALAYVAMRALELPLPPPALSITVVPALFLLFFVAGMAEELGWSGYGLGTVATRVLHTWLYNNTGRSVFGAALFHAMTNVSWQLFPNQGSHYDPRINGIILAIAAICVTIAWGPRTLARSTKP
jgi:hypothetical protein